jgi:hypothetical protein
MEPCNSDNKYLPSLMPQSATLRPTIDAKLREAFRPVISDDGDIMSNNFQELLKDTHAALIEENNDEKSEETREALTLLIGLLEENINLRSILDQSLSRIQKA